MNETPIKHVSDTALWVAHYRAKETKRPDALFRDPLAEFLMGERGKTIARKMKGLRYPVEWVMVGRTLVIDDYILNLVKEGVDTVINMGAGLDTRPYRLQLPSTLRWIEIDFPHMIAHKNDLLKSEIPTCQLIRTDFDLTDGEKRRAFLSQIASQSQKTLIITEGVIGYLPQEQVTALAHDLYSHLRSAYWIAEGMNSRAYKIFQETKRRKKMKNAPLQFQPEDWRGFFTQYGWIPKEIRYLREEMPKYGRKAPLPWRSALRNVFGNKKVREEFRQMSAYVVYMKAIQE